MKSIGRLFIVAAIVIAANLIFWSKKVELVDHTAKPQNIYAQRAGFERHLSQYQTPVVLMGNSMLTEGVDPKAFMSYTRTRTLRFSLGGSATAWWYLGLKNVIAESPNKPNVVAIFFRDHYLTEPGHRVNDTYKLSINDMANEQEPLLDRLAYLNGMDYPTYLLSKHSPLYQQKDVARKEIDSFIKYNCVSGLLGSDSEKIDAAMLGVFDKKNMNQLLMTADQLGIESTASEDKTDFNVMLKKSFLPHMIDIAEKSDIQLVFVRVKKRRDINPNAQPQHLKDYVENLRTYLASHDIELIDFTDNRRLKLEHYADGDHLNRTKGIPLFTKMAASELLPIINKHCK